MSNALHRLQMRLVFAAVFALLFSQLGATAHGYSHDAVAQSRTSHQSGAANHSGCNDCIAYAAVLSAAGAPGSSPCVAPTQRGTRVGDRCDTRHDVFLALGFRSRAPPVTA